MSVWDWARVAAILGPVAGLLLLGLWLTLRSGLVGLRPGQGFRRILANASEATFLLAGSLVAMAFAHRIVGFRLDMVPW